MWQLPAIEIQTVDDYCDNCEKCVQLDSWPTDEGTHYFCTLCSKKVGTKLHSEAS